MNSAEPTAAHSIAQAAGGTCILRILCLTQEERKLGGSAEAPEANVQLWLVWATAFTPVASSSTFKITVIVCIIKQKRSFLLLNAPSLQKKLQVSKRGAMQHFNFEIY